MTLAQSTNTPIQWVDASYISEKIIATLQHMMDRPEVQRIIEAHERRVAEKDEGNVELTGAARHGQQPKPQEIEK